MTVDGPSNSEVAVRYIRGLRILDLMLIVFVTKSGAKLKVMGLFWLHSESSCSRAKQSLDLIISAEDMVYCKCGWLVSIRPLLCAIQVLVTLISVHRITTGALAYLKHQINRDVESSI